jgi:predicted 3-demethylubiquinone-9 3-methyltransferase (glyoxalase superfamily)
MQKITPCLWFNNDAEEAVKLYMSVFKDGKMLKESRYDKASAEVSGQTEGSILTCEFELFGQKFMALNGGPLFKFTEAVSLVVDCDTQEEVDAYWNALTADGGEESQCGWLKDKFGLSWQITPKQLGEFMSDPDPKKAQATMQAMLSMKKLDIAALQAAHDNA